MVNLSLIFLFVGIGLQYGSSLSNNEEISRHSPMQSLIDQSNYLSNFHSSMGSGKSVSTRSYDNSQVRRMRRRKKKQTSPTRQLKKKSNRIATTLAPMITSSVGSTTTTRPNSKVSSLLANRTKEEARFLSLFTIVTFSNDVCSSGTGTNGTCYSTGDCSSRGGSGSGSCASGFGVCCIFTKTCGQTASVNCTYFQSAGYPSTYSSVGSCQLTVNKLSNNICQLRLDFNNFVTSAPDSVDQNCVTDQLVVSGGSAIPPICGTNTGQHIYVDLGQGNTGPAVLSMVTGSTSTSRSFSIKVSQIECTQINKAPDGCLQYLTGVSGQVQTFNYQSAAGLQLSKTDYTACIRMERNFCGIQYTACTTSGTTATTGAFSISPGPGTNVGTACTADWITIPCATNTMDPAAQTTAIAGTTTACVDRICGMAFNSITNTATISVPVYSYAKPFTIHVHTNAVEGTQTPAETLNRGFCLNYVQQPCTTSTSG